ncbi:unnamed protein product [Adineta steineri]|uniref:PRISE-like Rossmann-fold domain-containing protein n=1 Tax=Adineta steineri TaxID=433720 RepID=A0A819NAI2_9BILA|nr:unnamed protein product [Adineta steineri]CAF3994850.1 unnamed protein product [Adineta steineri]
MSSSSSLSPRVACIWGANGISGTAMIDLLIEQSSNEWNYIICISRRPFQLDINDKRIDFISIDILNSTVDEIVNELEKVNGKMITDIFHYTYIEKSTEDELDQVNKIVLEKALDACVKIAGKTIKSFSLQTGYKYYGVHKTKEDLAALPFTENAPRHQGANFYFTQEDLLEDYAKKHNWRYIITRPATIIGVAKGNFMNFAVTIALYATIQKELGQPLLFPGNLKSWNRISDHSTASNNARFQLWSVLNENIQHEIFNIANGDLVTFRDLWSKIENYFGIPHCEQKLNENEAQLKLVEYMPKHKDVWIRIAQRENLDEKAFDYATWAFADGSLRSPLDRYGNLTKAREFGWTTIVDTFDGYAQCFDRLKKLKVIPS